MEIDSFKEYQRKLEDGQLKSHEAFDKTLILISSGGLALSMVFVEKLGGSDPVNAGWLVASWIFLGITLLLSLTSALISTRDYATQIKEFGNLTELYEKSIRLDRELAAIEDTGPAEVVAQLTSEFKAAAKEADDFHVVYGETIARLNARISFLTFSPYATLLIGVGCLIYFASTNILNPKPDATRTKTESTVNTFPTQTRAGYQGDSTTTPSEIAPVTTNSKEVKKEASN